MSASHSPLVQGASGVCVNAYGRALHKSYKKQFNPYLGIPWSVNSKTVVRAAYRLFNLLEATGANLRCAE